MYVSSSMPRKLDFGQETCMMYHGCASHLLLRLYSCTVSAQQIAEEACTSHLCIYTAALRMLPPICQRSFSARKIIPFEVLLLCSLVLL